ncbi:hypothetical protein [Candidatus Spongiihabitans sp.]|uniref:hypothetical protein n=1 Tax=Candidatus Spongiihabitans sp. TaxID=3101308 RepID=UPI003C7B5E29
MNKQTIKTLILSVALGWAMQSISQDDVSETNIPAIYFVGDPIKTYPATPLKKILWGGVALINPSDQYTPVPLYGYSVDGLWDTVYEKALIEAAKGNVHIAMVKWDRPSAGVYTIQGVRVNPMAEEKFKSSWNQFRKDNIKDDSGTNWLIAFTRPLKFDDKNVVKETEFIVSPGLWWSSPKDRGGDNWVP